MNKRYDELFGQIVAILRRDWAGKDLLADRFDPRYYNTAVGQAWHDGKLDELLFLRYINQMLACTGDRHLCFGMRPSSSYEPWGPGFFTRRYGDSLYVTALRGESRLAPGDRITAINGASPARHRAGIQKNFFGDTTEREDWNGFLKMADTIDVEHADGARETFALAHHPLSPVPAEPKVYESAEGLVLDLRNVTNLTEERFDDLLPLVVRGSAARAALFGGSVYVNYTSLNCAVKAAALRDVPGGEDYIEELREKAGKGFLLEPDDDDSIVEGRAPKRVAVLVDTWTRDGAEALALAAKRAGAHIIGRPTLGTLDLAGEVSLALDDRYALTWPTAISQAAYEGRPLGPVEPDEHIPWTPAECGADPLMDAAENYLKNS